VGNKIKDRVGVNLIFKKSSNTTLCAKEIKFRLEILAFLFSMILYPLWRVLVYFSLDISEPIFARILPIIYGAIWFTTIWIWPELKKKSNLATLILSMLVTAEFYYLSYYVAGFESAKNYGIYVTGIIVIIVAYLSCIQSLKSLYIYLTYCLICSGVFFYTLSLTHHDFYVKTDSGHNALHHFTVMLIVFVITRKRLQLEQILENSLGESRAEVILSAKMASLGVMAAGVAHEINNPLNVISGMNRMLRLEVSKTNGEIDRDSLKKYSASVDLAVNKIAQIVNELTEVSRSRPDKNGFEPTDVDFTLKRAILQFEEKFKTLDIKLQHLISSNTLVLGNDQQLEKIFIHLLSNAEDAVKMSDSSERLIYVEVREKNGYVDVSFKDSGIPITKDIKDRMFDPFYTTKDVGHGTGLGLSVAKGIVDSHSGHFTINLEPKEIIVSLPVFSKN
jgi:signal transduction histidine kinase